MKSKISLRPVLLSEKKNFLLMAELYFKELNPKFKASKEFKQNFLESIFIRSQHFVEYILLNQKIIGFIKFGIHQHYYLNQKQGTIFDFYILKTFRKQGLGKITIKLLLKFFKKNKVKKIKIEIINENQEAINFWMKVGFLKKTLGCYLII